MKLFGLRITRIGMSPVSHVVWSGTCEARRKAHKQFVLESVYCPEYDGIMTFAELESDIIIDAPVLYSLSDGRIVRIEKIDGVTAYGHIMRHNAKGKMRRTGVVFWCYINGYALPHLGGAHVVSKIT